MTEVELITSEIHKMRSHLHIKYRLLYTDEGIVIDRYYNGPVGRSGAIEDFDTAWNLWLNECDMIGIPGKSGFKARTKARYENLVNGGKT